MNFHFIYKTISRADSEYAEWLHKNGFYMNGLTFKLFVFGNLNVPQYQNS